MQMFLYPAVNIPMVIKKCDNRIVPELAQFFSVEQIGFSHSPEGRKCLLLFWRGAEEELLFAGPTILFLLQVLKFRRNPIQKSQIITTASVNANLNDELCYFRFIKNECSNSVRK